MASGDTDHIEVMETSFVAKKKENSSAAHESGSEDDDRDKSSNAERNASYDVSGMGPAGGKVHKSDRKIGHRRVGEGGEITYKKIQSSQIMGSIQLGIQHAVGGLASKPERDLLMQDFMTVETTNFPHEGSNHTPAHHFSEFKFKTYAPIAFRYFRDLFGIQPDDFLMSMCSASLRELSNPGASGSIFYLTNDDEFIIKTVQHKEGEFLQKLLPGYYMNLNQNPRTLLPKFFGLYCYQCNSKNVRLVAMNNLLPSVVKLHQKYDLKGSTYKRKASKSEQKKGSPTYKDLDFMEHHPEGIYLEADTYGALIKTIQRDCRVLESFKIMDYSLLVGIHNLDEAQREKAEERKHADAGQSDDDDAEPKRTGLNRSRSINRQRLVAHSTAMESIQAESEPIDEEEDVPPGGIPARSSRGERLLLFVGVIDILQSYRLRKKLEHTWKSMIHDGDTVSVHRPGFYAQRFLDFMAKTVFKKIPSPLKHSPSKRKSITRPIRPLEELDAPGVKLSAFAGKPIKDFTPGTFVLQHGSTKYSPRSSVRSSMSDFTDTTESTWYHRQSAPRNTEYPSVLSDRIKIPDRHLYGSREKFQKRLDFDSPKRSSEIDDKPFPPHFGNYRSPLSEQIESYTTARNTGTGSSHINGSLTDSGIQTDNTSTSVPQIYVVVSDAQTDFTSSTLVTTPSTPVRVLRDAAVDTRNENNLQDIPFIDDEEMNEYENNRQYLRMRKSNIMEKHKSMSNIPERIEEASSRELSLERLSSSLNRARSPTFVERFKKFFTDLGIGKSPQTTPIRVPEMNTLPKTVYASQRESPGHSFVETRQSPKLRDASTLPKDMRFRKAKSSQTVYIKHESPTLARAEINEVAINVRPYSDFGRVTGHVSVVKVNGEEQVDDSSREVVLKEIVYVKTLENQAIYSGKDGGSTIIVVEPPAD